MSAGHALFSPSAAHRWIECPGSFAYPANTGDDESSSVYADDGTASHTWAAMCLKSGQDAEYFIGTECTINGRVYKMDEERARYVQVYLDKVRELAMGAKLYIEQWVDLSEYTGEGQGGTADAAIIVPQKRLVIAADLKYGMGEKVDASYLDEDGTRLPNHQLGLYGLGVLKDAEMMGYEIDTVLLVVIQPRLYHIDEQPFPVGQIKLLGERARAAAGLCGQALVLPPEQAQHLMHPGTKTCRWCRAQATCPKLAKHVADEVRADFETIAADPPNTAAEMDTEALSRAAIAVPLIEQWCKAVRIAVHEAVDNGLEVIGPDGQPMKFVEGDKGNRKWTDEAAAEALLLGQIGAEKAYAPRKIITAPQAAKILDKKKTKNLWTEHFEPLITRAPGKPVLALGSDPRPPYSGKAEAGDFEEEPDITA